MTPAFKISANNRDVTAKIAARLLSLTVKDEAGSKADTVDIVLDDRDGAVEEPPEGAELEVFIGYEGSPLRRMGLYAIDEVTLHGPPDKISFRGLAADLGGALKGQKTRGWEAVTLADIVKRVAADQGLRPVVSERFAATTYTFIAQTDESDIHLLTRLGQEHDALVAVKDGRLLFTTKGEGRTASGVGLPMTIITKGDHTTHKMSRLERGKYKAVKAAWSDKEGGRRKTVTVGDGEPVKRLRHTYSTEAEARRAAAAQKDAMERGVRTLSLTLPGAPNLFAEGLIEAREFRRSVNGIWAVKSISHVIADGGFKTTVEAEQTASG